MRPEIDAKSLYFDCFGEGSPHIATSHGRLEMLGNHTDHNHGLCLVAGASIGITSAFCPRQDGYVKIKSEGYPPIEFPISDLDNHPNEKGTTKSLTRGVLAYLKEKGYEIKGFSAAMVSDIPSGAGVSSSACYEALIGAIASYLAGKAIDPLLLAKASQFAENVYFGKPCGLLDQIGVCYGGVNYLDFKDPENPLVEPLKWNLPFDIILINQGKGHGKLTNLYASIPADMKEVAKTLFGKEYLRDVDPKLFLSTVSRPTPGVDERKKMRAQHFFDENIRVLQSRRAILMGQSEDFLDAVRRSQLSSQMYLGNTMVPGIYEGSMQQCIDFSLVHIGGGAIRIMGGGFGGSCIAFLPRNQSEGFLNNIARAYGPKAAYKVEIPEGGPKID